MREYVAAVRAAAGDLTPPIYLAALRDRMLGLAVEIAQGAIWANAAPTPCRCCWNSWAARK